MLGLARSCEADTFTRFITSWAISPLALAVIRGIIAIYIFSVVLIEVALISIYDSPEEAGVDFSYFTVLTYWGLAFYFAVSSVHGFLYATRGPVGLSSSVRNTGGRRFLRWAHGAFYTTNTCYPPIVTAVFWGVLSYGAFDTRFTTWTNISEHAMNTVFAVFEMTIPRTEPTAWIHIGPLAVILALYLGLAYVSHAVNGYYVYPFLDVQTEGSALVAGIIVAILVAAIIVFAVVHFLIKFRVWLTESKLGLYGKFSKHDSRLGGAQRSIPLGSMEKANV